MDTTGIKRQNGSTSRLAINITLNLMRGKTIAGICSTAQIKNNLITRVYAILAAQNLSNSLTPKMAGSQYVFTQCGGSLEIILENSLTTSSFSGKKLDCVFSDPGRLTLVERSIIIPSCNPKFEFLDDYNPFLQQSIILPQIPTPNNRISSR